MEVYLDNSATTRCLDEVREYMDGLYDKIYGNPSSLHHMGVLAEKEIKRAKEIIAGSLKASEKEIIFTSGGTESDNMAIFGTVLSKSGTRKGKHIISTEIEHPAVLMPLKELSERGYEVTLLPVDRYGCVEPAKLRSALRDDTVFVSVMHTNNEIGSLSPLAELSEVIKEKDPSIVFHVDAVQGYGKFRINPKKLGIDLLSVSAHKIHGPKGVGFIYVGYKTKIDPIIFGGGQQGGLRSGTENVQGIGGMAEAVRIIYNDLEQDVEKLYELKAFFVDGLLNTEGVAGINGLKENIRETAPHIVSVSFEDIRAEVLLHALEEKGIYVSAGSACSSNKKTVSSTLKAIGLDKKYLDSTLRFSFSRETTREELEYTLKALRELLPVLRRYVRR